MRSIYLSLAIAGAVVPSVFYVQHFANQGPDPMVFLSAMGANQAVRGLSADLVLASLAFWAAMFHDRRQRGGPNPVAFVALTLLIGLSCAIPAYLYARTREIGEAARTG